MSSARSTRTNRSPATGGYAPYDDRAYVAMVAPILTNPANRDQPDWAEVEAVLRHNDCRARRRLVAWTVTRRPVRPGRRRWPSRAARPRPRRAASSSTTSGSDPGGDEDPDASATLETGVIA